MEVPKGVTAPLTLSELRAEIAPLRLTLNPVATQLESHHATTNQQFLQIMASLTSFNLSTEPSLTALIGDLQELVLTLLRARNAEIPVVVAEVMRLLATLPPTVNPTPSVSVQSPNSLRPVAIAMITTLGVSSVHSGIRCLDQQGAVMLGHAYDVVELPDRAYPWGDFVWMEKPVNVDWWPTLHGIELAVGTTSYSALADGDPGTMFTPTGTIVLLTYNALLPSVITTIQVSRNAADLRSNGLTSLRIYFGDPYFDPKPTGPNEAVVDIVLDLTTVNLTVS